MSNELIANDAIVAQNFFLEVDGEVVSLLTGVSGLDMEVDVVSTTQAGKNGQTAIAKTMGTAVKAPDISLTRIAPLDAVNDKLWKWFGDVRGKGMAAGKRADFRKNGSIVLYDASSAEIARFNFFHAWPSKISTDALSAESNDAVKENITLVCERLDRVK